MGKTAAEVTARRYVTIEEAGQITSFSRTFLYQLMTAGKLEYSRVGRTRRIPADALAKLMADGTVPARPQATS